MRDWGFWDWLAYITLGLAALIEAGNTGLRSAPDLAEALPHIFKAEWLGFLPLGLFLAATIILLLRATGIIRNKKRKPAAAEPIDWALWKKFPSFTVRELSRLLAKEDPVSDHLSPRAKTIQRMLFASMKNGGLPYQKEQTGALSYALPSFDTRITKQDAIWWAKQNEIDVSHIEE